AHRDAAVGTADRDGQALGGAHHHALDDGLTADVRARWLGHSDSPGRARALPALAAKPPGAHPSARFAALTARLARYVGPLSRARALPALAAKPPGAHPSARFAALTSRLGAWRLTVCCTCA